MTSDADDKIVSEAKTRFRRCQDREASLRDLAREDQRFVEGDSDNNYQWDKSIRTARIGAARPCLTINRTRQHCLQIMNDARQNKAQIRINATGGDASYDSAKIYEGICRHIEYQSDASEVYEAAYWHQITHGTGYWRVVTEYADDDGDDQEIYLRRVKDPFSIYLDPDISEFNGLDARFGFVYRDMPREEFDLDYPELKGEGSCEAPLGEGGARADDPWSEEGHVRIAEYFRKVETRHEMVSLPAGGDPVRRSSLERNYPDVWSAYKDHPDTRRREVVEAKIEWFKIIGGKIVERNIWPGRYIPIVRVIGEETIIDGQLDRKGHVRAMKDPQRMYNYQSSGMVEEIALQSKAPWVAPLEAIEGLETYWSRANTEARSVLIYKHKDGDGQPLPAPTRQPPPTISAGRIEAMKIAQQEMMMASGQYQSQFGENENAKSGVAIQTRERQGDNATFHYIDHAAQAIKATGKILIDLIPKVYDTQRIRKIMAEDGSQDDVVIDPNAPMAHQMVAPASALGQNTPNGLAPVTPEQAKQLSGDAAIKAQIKTVFNPNVGKYSVEADIGPTYATRRQETFAALTQLLGNNEHLQQMAGDLLFKAADFPLADEIAERLRRTIPPQVLGEGPPPQLAALQQQAEAQMQQMQGVIAKLMQENAEAKMKLKDRDADLERENYDAETRRAAVMAGIDPQAFVPMIRQLMSEMMQTPIVPEMAAHAAAELAMQPPPDAGGASGAGAGAQHGRMAR